MTYMSIFDITLLVILAGFVLNGLVKGIIRMVGHLIGLIVGAYVASNYYLYFYGWIQGWAAGHENLWKVLVFIIVFVLVARLVDFGFLLVEKIFKFIAIIPGSKYINNLIGALADSWKAPSSSD